MCAEYLNTNLSIIKSNGIFLNADGFEHTFFHIVGPYISISKKQKLTEMVIQYTCSTMW